MNRKPFEKRLAALKQEAEIYRSTCQEISEYVVPTRGLFTDAINQVKKIDHTKFLNSEPLFANRILGAGLYSGLTSQARDWFNIGVPYPELMDVTEVKEWCTEIKRRIHDVLSRSNIYGSLHNAYEEFTFGTAAIFIKKDFDSVIRATTFTWGEYYIGSTSNEKIDTFAREFHMTVGQVVKKFGIDNVSDQVSASYKNGDIDKWVKVCHLIEPNDDRIEGKIDNSNKAFRSIYWEFGSTSDTILRSSGYDYFPVLTPRWQTRTTSDIWGFGPGWEALGDAKSGHEIVRDELTLLAKEGEPPIIVSADTTANVLPGGITVTDKDNPDGGVRPAYQVKPNYQAIELIIARVNKTINRAFYADLFQTLHLLENNPQMTAREIAERVNEGMRGVGPVYDNIKNELLDPLITLIYNYMLDVGLIPPAPEQMKGMELRIEYISILAQAQKASATVAVDQTLDLAERAAKINPEVIDNIDIDEAIRFVSDAVGCYPKIIRSKDEVAALRQQRQEQMQQQQQQQNIANGIQSAKTLGDTKLNNNSALDAIMKNAAGGSAA